MSSETWTFAVDFGTCHTTAAVFSEGRTDMLELDGSRRLLSAVALADDGTIVVGEAAANRAVLEPDRVERTPKTHLDVGETEIVLGDRSLPITKVVGAVIAVAYEEALRQHSGRPPRKTCITHPASWSRQRQTLLREAAAIAGLPAPELISEPEAAALYLSRSGIPVADGATVAVYDLGGGTFDTAVLRRRGDRFELLGVPGGSDGMGGERFDDRLYEDLGNRSLDPSVWEALQRSPDTTWRAANRQMRDRVRAAKEAVSKAASHPIFLPAPVNQELQVTREEFQNLIRDDITKTLDLFQETLDRAGVRADELSALYLVGGSSRIPLVARMVEERFGRADTKGDPKAVVALGAAQRLALQDMPKPQPKQQPKPPPIPVRTPQSTPSSWRSGKLAGALAAAGITAVVATAVALGSGGSGGTPTPTPTSTPSGSVETPVVTETPTETPTEMATETPDVTELLVGEWAGTASNGVEDVSVSLVFDANGTGDGALGESSESGTCAGTLDFDNVDGNTVVFTYEETQNPGECTSGSVVTVTYDPSDDTIEFIDEFSADDGTPMQVTGYLERD